ncbi:MAG: 50S ribosomal protein L24 [Candidatus Aenigmarchaeota archaeon]|nr:50S ribosomal protein L24 [Candidatus Aenigmarchaeota archaeon]MDI6722032.1 50S ribosomal protein L24 [Candidatus Aenigmarchaeota archaeon]
MKTLYSPAWKSSAQTRKQRKYRYNAPLHARHRMLSAHLSKELRKEMGFRSLPLRKGDEVAVMKGEFKKSRGKVLRADLKELRVYIEGIKRKKVSGQEVDVPLDPSNLKITKLNLDDSRRKKAVERKKQAKYI